MTTSPHNQTIAAVILAAGHGTRMKSDLPKVMHLLHGKPLVEHMVDIVETCGMCQRTVVVVSPLHSLVEDHLKNRAEYTTQQEQLGTAHALATAEELLKDKVDHVVVMYGDVPSLTGNSLKQLVEKHLSTNAIVTMTTSVLPDYEDWRSAMFSFGRVIRNNDGAITSFVEKKDATPEQQAIKEVNVGFYCFRSDWLWEHLPLVKNNNVQKEYYINDLVDMAMAKGITIESIAVEPKEAIGISTQKDLSIANGF